MSVYLFELWPEIWQNVVCGGEGYYIGSCEAKWDILVG